MPDNSQNTLAFLGRRPERERVAAVVADAELMHPVIEIIHRLDDLGAVFHPRPQRIHVFGSLQTDIELACEARAFPLRMRIRRSQHDTHSVAIQVRVGKCLRADGREARHGAAHSRRKGDVDKRSRYYAKSE
jgi:hypothetical protein